jgi:hypothetical protein
MTFVHRLVWSAVVACLVCPAFADEAAVPVEQAPAVEQAPPEGEAAAEDGQELLNDAINAKLEIDEIDEAASAPGVIVGPGLEALRQRERLHERVKHKGGDSSRFAQLQALEAPLSP